MPLGSSQSPSHDLVTISIQPCRDLILEVSPIVVSPGREGAYVVVFKDIN
jgi:hypothetical protein